MKLLVIKKTLPILIGTIVLFGAFLGIICQSAYGVVSSTLPTIVLDAGHGGIDAGVRGIITGVKESDVNLDIAWQLRGKLVNAGFEVVMTRNSQGGLYGAYSKGFKMRDMKKRKEIINKANADMVISIHQNFCPLPSRRGAQVFFNGESGQGKAFADCVQASLNGMEECVKQTSALAGDYYMLKCTTSPSIIVECGFLSNTEDEKLLITKEYQTALAQAIFKGILQFLAQKK